MLDQPTLLSRLGPIAQLKGELLNQYHDHALVGEFLERLQQAQDILDKGRQRKNLDYSALMFAAFCLNRCEAIFDQFKCTGISPVKSGSAVSTNILVFSKERILTRWLFAQATRLRAKLLNYSNYYHLPPLHEYITVVVVQLLDRNGKLFRLLRKLRLPI